jgi:hypothetical protein
LYNEFHDHEIEAKFNSVMTHGGGSGGVAPAPSK